jgi:hypothetical protein
LPAAIAESRGPSSEREIWSDIPELHKRKCSSGSPRCPPRWSRNPKLTTRGQGRKRSEVFDVAGGDVVGWVGVEPQIPVVGVAEASFQLSPIVAAGFREPVAEGVPQVVRAEDPEMAVPVGGLGVVDAAYLPDDGVD